MEVLALPLAVIKATWWFITPIILFRFFKESWLYWRHVRYWNTLTFALLEVKLPPDVLKTPKAMEYALVGLHGLWDELKWKDIWIKGETLPWLSLEVVGTGGDIHFYIYTQRKYIDFVESQIYAQYPEAEILEVDDYTSKIPPNVPNENWDVWGTDLRLTKPNAYPLRIYEDMEDVEEERRLDSMSSLAEIMNKLRPGEHIWVQVIIEPPFAIDELKGEGDKVIAKLMSRKEKKKKGFTDTMGESLGQVARQAVGLPAGEEAKEDPFASTEFRLTPGEREVLKQIDAKTAKVSFYTMIRFIYMGKKDVFTRANVGALFGFFRQFNTYNMNAFRPNSKTLPKRSFIYFRKLRLHFRKFRIVQWYRWRVGLPGSISPYFLLNVQELASIFHLPGLVVKAPMMPRVESRAVPPPAGLPVEEY